MVRHSRVCTTDTSRIDPEPYKILFLKYKGDRCDSVSLVFMHNIEMLFHPNLSEYIQ